MNVSSILTIIYQKVIPLAGQKNKPNSNPIKANLQKAKMNINSLITKDYRKKEDFEVRINKPKTKPISEKPKMNVNAFSQKDYENKTALRPQKNKPNSNPISNECSPQYYSGSDSIQGASVAQFGGGAFAGKFLCHFSLHSRLSPTSWTEWSVKMPFILPFLCRSIQNLSIRSPDLKRSCHSVGRSVW